MNNTKCVLDMTVADLRKPQVDKRLVEKTTKVPQGKVAKLIRHSNKRYAGADVVVLKNHNDGTFNVQLMGTETFLLVSRWQLGDL